MSSKRARAEIGLISLLLGLAVWLVSLNALAWKPYTHVTLANKARDEVLNSGQGSVGSITINGRSYVVRPELVAALREFPSVFDGGTVGPDGFPDVIFGQMVIHPHDTGEWMKLVLARAWQSQGTPEFSRNLAFAYGFLAHGAGDMWGHTFVNKYAQGVFPSITQAFTDVFDPSKIIKGDNFAGLSNATRHLITEYYVGDATAGYDANPAFGLAPFAYPGVACTDPSVCNYKNSTTGIQIDSASDQFVYNTLLGGDQFVQSFFPNSTNHPDDALSPSENRGTAIDFFLSLRKKLIGYGASINPAADFQAAMNAQIDAFNSAVGDINAALNVCSNIGTIWGTPIPDPVDVFKCIGALAVAGVEATFDLVVGSIETVFDLLKASVEVAFGPVIKAYLTGWVKDIDDGLRAWNQVGLQSSRGLFDPETERELADMECQVSATQTVETCKAKFGLFNRLEASLDQFKSEHLWFMLGLPHWVSAVGEILGKISSFIDGIIDAVLPINPIEKFISSGYEYFKGMFEQFVRALIKHFTGVDVNAIEEISKSPEAFLDLAVLPPGLTASLFGITVPEPGISLFPATDHPELDARMALPADHHVLSDPPLPGWPAITERLKDDVQFQEGTFAAAFDTVTQTKLLMLDGPQLNKLLGETLFDANVFTTLPSLANPTVRTFVNGAPMPDALNIEQDPSHLVPANVMINQYAGLKPWLRLIDGDHAWRKDGKPIFADRDPEVTGGNGQYPMWTSCALRPAFRAIFKDWEHSAACDATSTSTNFCDDGDFATADPVNDPPIDPANPNPLDFKVSSTNTFTSPTGVVYAKSSAVLTLSAPRGDAPFTVTAGRGKPAAATVRWQSVPATGPVQQDNQVTGETLPVSFSLLGADGPRTVTGQIQDPCHTFEPLDTLQAWTITKSLTLDNTPPGITINKPRATPSYNTAETMPIDVVVTDGPGSGVNSVVITLDGAAVSNGQVLDFFFFSPGKHTLVVVATDNLGNSATASQTFRIQATAASLLSNWDRARSMGLITDQNLYDTYRRTLVLAVQQDAQGQFAAEQSTMNQFLEAVLSARNETVQCTTTTCRRIDITTASRFVTFADLLQANAGVATINSTNTAEGILEILDAQFLLRQVGTLGSYNALRHLLQQAIGHDKAGQRATEKSDLQAFVQQVAAMRGQTGASCTNPDSGCYGLSASAASALTTAANAVIATL